MPPACRPTAPGSCGCTTATTATPATSTSGASPSDPGHSWRTGPRPRAGVFFSGCRASPCPPWRNPERDRLERNVVVVEAFVRGTLLRALGHVAGRLARRAALLAAHAAAAAARTAALAGAAQHLHLAGDDVGAVALDAFLVSVLLGAQAALDVHLAPLAQVLAHDFRQAAEGLDPVPLGAFLVLAGLLVLPLLRGGDPDAADGHAAGRVADLGVGAEVA